MIKLVIFVGLLSATLAAIVNRQSQYDYDDHRLAPSGQQIPILRLVNEISPEGTYHYEYQTGNGISAEESGQVRGAEGGTAAQGSYQYTSPEGVPVQIQYVADENGYQPAGNVLPTPPPIPVAIQRSLEYIAAHPEPQEQVYQPQYYTTQRNYNF